jgi:hypothetical protein
VGIAAFDDFHQGQQFAFGKGFAAAFHGHVGQRVRAVEIADDRAKGRFHPPDGGDVFGIDTVFGLDSIEQVGFILKVGRAIRHAAAAERDFQIVPDRLCEFGLVADADGRRLEGRAEVKVQRLDVLQEGFDDGPIMTRSDGAGGKIRAPGIHVTVSSGFVADRPGVGRRLAGCWRRSGRRTGRSLRTVGAGNQQAGQNCRTGDMRARDRVACHLICS